MELTLWYNEGGDFHQNSSDTASPTVKVRIHYLDSCSWKEFVTPAAGSAVSRQSSAISTRGISLRYRQCLAHGHAPSRAAHSHDLLTGEYKGLALWAQYRKLWWAILAPELLPPFHRYWSQWHSLINNLQPKLQFSVLPRKPNMQ